MSPAISVLLVLHEFNAGGVQYAPGDLVPSEAPDTWPEGSLETRLEHHFIKYVPAHRAPQPPTTDGSQPGGEGESTEPVDPTTDLLLLEKMTKAQLAEFALTEYGVELDADKLKKEDLLLEVRQLIEEHGSGE